MSNLIMQPHKYLTPVNTELAKKVKRFVKQQETQDRILLIRDTCRAIAGRKNTDFRHLLCRNVWATTKELTASFDEVGGSELVRGYLGSFQDIPLNHPEFLRLESKILVDFLGSSATAKLGLGTVNLRKLADEAMADNGLKIISKTWTLHNAMKTCGCRPAASPALDSKLAMLNPLKAIALAALIAADLVAFSTPATIPLGAISLATAAILLRRGC